MEFEKNIKNTAERIARFINHTPLQYSPYLSKIIDGNVYLKLENIQKTGSFKFRGAMSKISSLAMSKNPKKVITASTGNHGAACSLAMSLKGVDGSIYVPKNAHQNKIDKIKLYGADVKYYGNDCVETEMHAKTLSIEHGFSYISPYNDMDVIFGQGTVGYEIEQDLDIIDAIFISVGGGGLISGVGGYLKSLKREINIFGVSPINSCVMHESIKNGQITDLQSQPTLSDGTAGGVESGSITFDYCNEFIDEFITVTEEEIKTGMITCIDFEHCLVEGAAGAAVAGFLKKKEHLKGMDVVIVICGGNVSSTILKQITA